jgi:hypothetical protein
MPEQLLALRSLVAWRAAIHGYDQH